MNPLETFRLVVVYLLPALLALLLGTPSSPAGASPSFPSRNDANARRAPPGSAAVFVDGSVTQGKPAGVGVWYGVGHPLNFAAALPSPTFDDNNLAELAAVFVALIRHPRRAPMKIHTDSAYVIQTLNPDRRPTLNRRRRPGGDTPGGDTPARRSGDGSAAGSAAARRALTRAARLLLRWRAAATSFRKVRGHVGDFGNERADRLAALGSRSAFVAATVPATATDLFLPFGRSAWWPELLRFLSGEAGVGRGAIVSDDDDDDAAGAGRLVVGTRDGVVTCALWNDELAPPGGPGTNDRDAAAANVRRNDGNVRR